MRNFITPHCHPQSLDSASSIANMVQREVELQTGVITCTDHGSLAACHSVHEEAVKAGIKPILGLEAYFRDENCPILRANGITDIQAYSKYFHVTLHARNLEAYEALVRTSSLAPLERHGQELKPLINWTDLEELAGFDITVGSGCLAGMVQRHIQQHSNLTLAEAYYRKLRDTFGPDRFWVEVFPHLCSHFWVDAVFLEYTGGNDKFYPGKKVRVAFGTDSAEPEVVTVADLAKRFGSNRKVYLLGIKHRHTWHDLDTPQLLTSVKKVEGFLRNDPYPWCPDGAYQVGCNRVMMILAEKYGDRILISDDSHFAYRSDKTVQDIRLQAGGGSWKFHESYHRQSSEEAIEYFRTHMNVDIATLEEWIDNSYAWADTITEYTLAAPPSLPTKFYPQNTLEHTMHLIHKHGRMSWDNPDYVARLKTEIALLHQNGIMDLLPYFFIDEEVCSFFEGKQLLTGPGRGSAAGLLLSYLLGITHLDPIRYKLSLERFLTLDRIRSGHLPDIDQDVPRQDRDLLVNPDNGWLVERFGDHVVQVSTDTTLRLRSSIKDVCRVLYGEVSPEINQLTKRMQVAPQGVEDRDFILGYTAKDGSHIKGSIESDSALQEFVEKYPEAWEIVQKCLGLPRQKGRHPCSYVVANRPIHEFIPLTEVGGVKVTQYTAEAVESVGGLKMDFLGLNTLSDISSAIQLIQERHGISAKGTWTSDQGQQIPFFRTIPTTSGSDQLCDIWDLPEDPKVFKEICQGDTETVFQLNTPSATQWLRHFNYPLPDTEEELFAIHSMEGLAIFMALDRPGPLEAMVMGPNGRTHNMLVEYARRVRGEPKSNDIPPIFDELLPETHGILVFQEALQAIYQNLTGCTGSEAEEFRRNVAKKKVDKVKAAHPFFIEHASKTVGEQGAQQIWDYLQTWAAYGFCLSHAMSYAVIGYACAYLKHHYPLEWWTAVLRNAHKNEVNEKFWHYCSHLLDLPNLQNPATTFEIQDERIQAPIDLLLGVGEAAHKQLCQYAPYSSLEDFCTKMVQHQEETAKIVQNKKGQTVRRLGHNAITRGVVRCMIVTGTMDHLFAPDSSLLDKFAAFEETMRKLGKRAPKKDRLDLVHLDVDELIRYQMCKKILPAYSAPLLPSFLNVKNPAEYLIDEKDGMYTYLGHPSSPPILNATELYQVGYQGSIAEPIVVAALAYVNHDKLFTFGPKKDREGLALTLDLGGDIVEYVMWGEWESGKVDEKAKALLPLAGSIVLVVMVKKTTVAPYVIVDVEQITKPIAM